LSSQRNRRASENQKRQTSFSLIGHDRRARQPDRRRSGTSSFTRGWQKIKIELVRKKAALVVLLAALCYILGLVTAFYFPISEHLGGVLTRLLQGRVRPFIVSRNFNETMGYVTDRKAGPLADGSATYLGEYAGQVSYGLVNVQVPQHHPAGSALDSGAIKKVESIPYPAFLKFARDQSGKPLVIWIHAYRASFPVSTVHCAQVARDLNIDANVLTFDWPAANRSSATRATCFRSLAPQNIWWIC
jgi:hypothetical protein